MSADDLNLRDSDARKTLSGDTARSLQEAPGVELTILMPCLNEAETIEACLRKATHFLSSSGVAGEVVVADNGSTDASKDLARKWGARVVDVPTRGYGAALQAGIAQANGKFVIMGDSDDSYDFSALMPFLEALRRGDDLVMGNRFMGSIEPGAMPLLHRYLGNPVLSFIGQLFFKVPIGDFHCGLRGFNRQAILNLRLTTPGMEFASEMVVKAALHRLTISEVPTNLAKDGRSRPPHLRTWRDGWRHLIFLLIHSPRWLFLLPASLLVFAGAILMLALLPGPLVLGRVSLDVHTLVVAGAMIDAGMQTLMFWFIAKQYAISHGILPDSPWFKKAIAAFSLERLLIVGGSLVFLGVGGVTYTTLKWGSVNFDQLNYEVTMRQVVPSVTLIVVGLQIAFFAFVSSLIRFGFVAQPGRVLQAQLDAQPSEIAVE